MEWFSLADGYQINTLLLMLAKFINSFSFP